MGTDFRSLQQGFLLLRNVSQSLRAMWWRSFRWHQAFMVTMARAQHEFLTCLFRLPWRVTFNWYVGAKYFWNASKLFNGATIQFVRHVPPNSCLSQSLSDPLSNGRSRCRCRSRERFSVSGGGNCKASVWHSSLVHKTLLSQDALLGITIPKGVDDGVRIVIKDLVVQLLQIRVQLEPRPTSGEHSNEDVGAIAGQVVVLCLFKTTSNTSSVHSRSACTSLAESVRILSQVFTSS